MSFPRDTEVEIPGYGQNKLNAAFAFGGPALTIRTFREAFGIPIQHYLAVDFPGLDLKRQRLDDAERPEVLGQPGELDGGHEGPGLYSAESGTLPGTCAGIEIPIGAVPQATSGQTSRSIRYLSA